MRPSRSMFRLVQNLVTERRQRREQQLALRRLAYRRRIDALVEELDCLAVVKSDRATAERAELFAQLVTTLQQAEGLLLPHERARLIEQLVGETHATQPEARRLGLHQPPLRAPDQRPRQASRNPQPITALRRGAA